MNIPIMIELIINIIQESALREFVLWGLLNVPGLPPILQSIHILAVATLFASIGMINLRFLRLALPSQSPNEMIKRLAPWMWASLLTLLLTGSAFVIARPARYFYNPIAGIKLLCLTIAICLAALLFRFAKRRPNYWESSNSRYKLAQGISLCSISLWICTVFAGRWIAYLDYLF
jgi:uncharacterized membrane protein SirB2